jgi:hypothetical protein
MHSTGTGQRALAFPRARACPGARARGPGRPWGWGRIAGGAAARKGALGLCGSEFALRVVCELDDKIVAEVVGIIGIWHGYLMYSYSFGIKSR